jgi:uncharacterized protein with von Willebrand factor type A (vWA) domain
VSRFVDNLAVFGRLLRNHGIGVHVGRLLDLTEALQHVDVASRIDVHLTCRALLVHRHEDLALFDTAFDAFWRTHHASDAALQASLQADARSGTLAPPASVESADRAACVSAGAAVDDPAADDEAAVDAVGVMRTWSDLGAIAAKDFAEFTGEEIALARAALIRLVWSPGERRTRRWRSGRGVRVDLRRTLARSVRTGGEIVTLPRRRRRSHPRPIVLLCDVSGSMERYSRMLLHFAYEIGRRHRRAEVFLFSTQLTRITAFLRGRRLDEAVSAVSQSVPGWSDGTRTGDALRVFHQRWARVVLRRGPVVLLISDGWDQGDPIVLRDQVARLQRSCHRLIWLNPLIGTADYAPLTRGLVAALPFVDEFLPARTLINLSDLALHLNTLGTARRERH